MSLEGERTRSTDSRWEALDVAARQGWALISAPFLAERERWPLWLPVLMGVGIAAYFATAFSLAPGTAPVALAGLALAGFGMRRHPGYVLVLAVLGALLAGYGAMVFRSWYVAAPVLERPLAVAMLSGDVTDVEPLEHEGLRVVLTGLDFEKRPLGAMPERIRIRLPPKSPAVRPGQRIRLYVSLMPPSGPVLPGGFDFARHAWFQRLGAVGYGMGTVEILEEKTESGLKNWIADMRLAITLRIHRQLPGDSGAVAAALITGGERAISKPLLNAYRDSGLAHLLSVSGLHISLVAGLVFVGLRALLALIGPLALRYPIKKWTAVGAAGAALFYLFLSGAFVPTQRSFLMTAIVLLGVVLDRQAISMRLVAWAALAILLTQPESLLGASFQMSFAAVLALVALYELAQGPVSVWRRQGGWWRGFVLYVGLLALSSLVAGLATAPFAIDSFNRFNPYGVASNMLAVPLSGVLVMPAALISVLLMPLGLEQLALIPMGWGVDLINIIAYEVASWPGAGLAVPSFSPLGFAALVLGGLWLLLMRRIWRLLGLLGLLFGLSTLATVRLPDLLADGGNGLVALRLQDGRMLVTPGKKDPITREAWRRHLAIGGEPEELGQGAGDGLVDCDGLACRVRMKGVWVAFLKRPEGLLEDCAKSDLVIAPFAILEQGCEGPLVIDRRQRLRLGAHAVWLSEGRIERIETVNETRRHHPWVKDRQLKNQPLPVKERNLPASESDETEAEEAPLESQ
ncbi:MAG: ComEC family competence protein [Rhodospirillales bacterium]|nr:ComEC family competence protein [Rhodospirillales bacterium]